MEAAVPWCRRNIVGSDYAEGTLLERENDEAFYIDGPQ